METLPAFLAPLADPNIAFLLFVAGAILVAVELVHPNLITGVVGAVALILAFVGFGNLPTNIAGLLLLILGFVLFVLETQIASHGLLTIAGIVAIVVGSSVLYSVSPPPPGPPVQVAPAVTLVVAGTAGAVMGLVAIAAVRSRRMRATPGTIGSPIALGSEGVVQAPLAPTGTVYLAGETWSARTPDERLVPRDTPVRLLGFDNLVALVEPTPPADTDPDPNPAGPPAAARP